MQKETKKEKPYKRGDALTKQQEIFCEEVAKGETQTDAYLVAYPTSKNWAREAVWSQASILSRKDKIKKKIEELRENIYDDVNWTRKKVLANINYALNDNKRTVEQTRETYNNMIDDKYKELMQWVNLRNIENIDSKGVEKHIKKITNEINQLELQKNSIKIDSKGIVSLLQIVNRMQGYDITKEPEEENTDKIEELRQELSIEELRQLAYKKEEKE